MGTVCRKKVGCEAFQQLKKRQLKIQCFGVFEDENLNQKKSAWAQMLLSYPVLKKRQKYLPINFSKGTFFRKDR